MKDVRPLQTKRKDKNMFFGSISIKIDNQNNQRNDQEDRQNLGLVTIKKLIEDQVDFAYKSISWLVHQRPIQRPWVAWKIPKNIKSLEFLLFCKEENQITIEHIDYFTIQYRQVVSINKMKPKLFANSFIGEAWTWYIIY